MSNINWNYFSDPDPLVAMDNFTHETFDSPVFKTDSFTEIQPDYTLEPFSNSLLLDRATFDADFSSTWAQHSPTSLTPITPLSADLFRAKSGFPQDYFSINQDMSPTPPLCGNADQLKQLMPASHLPTSPISPPSPMLRNLKRESSASDCSDAEYSHPSPKRQHTASQHQPTPKRGKGRPRLSRASTPDSVSSTSSNPATSFAMNRQTSRSRLPHNQVERKYREGLNAELERLRRAVPTLLQGAEGAEMGARNPSKAMVLAGANEYIKRVERERDQLREEVRRLRAGLLLSTRKRA